MLQLLKLNIIHSFMLHILVSAINPLPDMLIQVVMEI